MRYTIGRELNMSGTQSDRVLGAVTLVGLALFVALMLRAFELFPGGTVCEPNAVGHRFWENFYCDLTGEITRRGEINVRAAESARAGFVSFAIALAPFFWLVGGMLSGRLRVVVRTLGPSSAVATVVLAWLPSVLSQTLHTTFVFAATIPGLVAMGAAVGGLLKSPLYALAVLGALALVLGSVNAAGYAWAIAHRTGCVPWLPAVQRLASIAMVAFMAGVSVVALARRKG
jgi:hypothetical protein